MTINRRKAMVALGSAAFGGVEWMASGAPFATALIAPRQVPAATADGSQATDLSRIGAHVYSEEGIPMFLACENLADGGTSPGPAAAPSELNKKVDAAFRRYTREWQRQHPKASAEDVAKIVEFLADRDVTRGGMEPSL